MWHMTWDLWNVTCDMWHVTSDTWHVTYDIWREVNILSKCQVPSSYGLGGLEGKDELVRWINELMHHKGVCRTASATPGLLKIDFNSW